MDRNRVAAAEKETRRAHRHMTRNVREATRRCFLKIDSELRAPTARPVFARFVRRERSSVREVAQKGGHVPRFEVTRIE